MKKVIVYLDRRAMGKSRRRIYSILDTRSGLVFTKNSMILLQNVELVVQQGGREDTLKRMKNGAAISKTVHSFLRGDLLYRGKSAKRLAKDIIDSNSIPVGYDPTKTNHWIKLQSFQMPDDVQYEKPIFRASYAYMHADGIQIRA